MFNGGKLKWPQKTTVRELKCWHTSSSDTHGTHRAGDQFIISHHTSQHVTYDDDLAHRDIAKWNVSSSTQLKTWSVISKHPQWKIVTDQLEPRLSRPVHRQPVGYQSNTQRWTVQANFLPTLIPEFAQPACTKSEHMIQATGPGHVQDTPAVTSTLWHNKGRYSSRSHGLSWT